jgi:drug/metabolite transporter (DMT)-like permease
LNPVDLGLVLISAFLHAWWSVSIKGSRDPISFNVLQEATALALFAALLPFVELSEISPRVWRLLAATGVAHSLYFYWMSRAYEHGDLTLVYPIARSTPAILPLVAVPLLGESISPAGGFGIALVVAGMWLVYAGAGLERAALASPAARYALLTLAATVVYSFVDKSAMVQLAADPWSSPVPRPLAYCVLLSTACAVGFVPLALLRRRPREIAAAARTDFGAATLASLVSFASYGLILAALETSQVSYVVAARQTSVLFALGLGVLWLRERPGRPRLAGGLATVAGVALIALFGADPG